MKPIGFAIQNIASGEYGNLFYSHVEMAENAVDASLPSYQKFPSNAYRGPIPVFTRPVSPITDWFPSNRKPVHVGDYIVEVENTITGYKSNALAYWDGAIWRGNPSKVMLMDQRVRWYGLTSKQ
jgi:5'-3' exonuclease